MTPGVEDSPSVFLVPFRVIWGVDHVFARKADPEIAEYNGLRSVVRIILVLLPDPVDCATANNQSSRGHISCAR